MTTLGAWQNFYVLLGSAAAALVGIQFVVIALIAARRGHVDGGALAAFGSPTVVHFGSALTLSAVLTAPWTSMIGPSVVLVLGGAAALIYTGVIFARARRQSDYQPVADDWLWYVILPPVLYALITLGGLLLHAAASRALFIIAAAGLGLLLVAIRNAWDTVTHVVQQTGSPEP